MITAAEAKLISDQGNEEDNIMAKAMIDNKVRGAASNGDSEVWLCGSYKVLRVAQRIAEAAGYAVDFSDNQKDGPTLKLFW